MQLTAVFMQVPEGYIAFVEEAVALIRHLEAHGCRLLRGGLNDAQYRVTNRVLALLSADPRHYPDEGMGRSCLTGRSRAAPANR